MCLSEINTNIYVGNIRHWFLPFISIYVTWSENDYAYSKYYLYPSILKVFSHFTLLIEFFT